MRPPCFRSGVWDEAGEFAILCFNDNTFYRYDNMDSGRWTTLKEEACRGCYFNAVIRPPLSFDQLPAYPKDPSDYDDCFLVPERYFSVAHAQPQPDPPCNPVGQGKKFSIDRWHWWSPQSSSWTNGTLDCYAYKWTLLYEYHGTFISWNCDYDHCDPPAARDLTSSQLAALIEKHEGGSSLEIIEQKGIDYTGGGPELVVGTCREVCLTCDSGKSRVPACNSACPYSAPYWWLDRIARHIHEGFDDIVWTLSPWVSNPSEFLIRIYKEHGMIDCRDRKNDNDNECDPEHAKYLSWETLRDWACRNYEENDECVDDGILEWLQRNKTPDHNNPWQGYGMDSPEEMHSAQITPKVRLHWGNCSDQSITDTVMDMICNLQEFPQQFQGQLQDIYLTSQTAYGDQTDIAASWDGPGQVTLYNCRAPTWGVLVHEAGHGVAFVEWTTPIPTPESPYGEAIASAEPPVSAYGGENAAEDFAEAFREFILRPDWVRDNFPNRYNALKEITERHLSM